MKCDVIAEGIIQGCSVGSIKVPVVVRLAGTNTDQAQKIIAYV